MVHVVDDAGTVHFIPGVHADPAQEPLLAAVGVPPPPLDSFSHLGQAFATGRLAIVTFTPAEPASPLIGLPSSSAVLWPLVGAGAPLVHLVRSAPVTLPSSPP